MKQISDYFQEKTNTEMIASNNHEHELEYFPNNFEYIDPNYFEWAGLNLDFKPCSIIYVEEKKINEYKKIISGKKYFSE